MFKLSILTPEKRLVNDQEIDEVVVPGYRGQLDVLPGHAPLLTTLTPGTLKYRLKGETTLRSLVVSFGYMEVNPQGVVVLAETAETADEIDRSRAEQTLKRSLQFLASLTISPEETQKYQRKMERAQARLALFEDERNLH
jgi:F-type H+-transporting ATPase subunit epsilon